MKPNESSSPWQQPLPAQFLTVVRALADDPSLSDFLRDVLTEKEILEISARLEAARLLEAKASYDVIQAETKLSTRTIARISRWRKEGTGGYDSGLNALRSAQHVHILPARAD